MFETIKRTVLFLSTALLVSGTAHAAMRPNSTDQEQSLIRKMYNHIEMMRHEIANHEAELQTNNVKFENMEDALETMRRQLDDALENYNKKMRGTSDTLDTKITSQESALKGMVTDLEKLQTHANKSSSILESYEKQISYLENIIEMQNRNLDDLKAAMKSLMASLGGDSDSICDVFSIYEVRSGDSLGLIAQKLNTSIRVIKDLNGLKKDTIFVGQKLKIPKG